LIKANPAVMRNHEQLLRVHRQAADIHRRAGRVSDALASLKQARQVAANLVDGHPDDRGMRLELATAHNNIGELLALMHEPAEAHESFDEAILIHRKLVAASGSTPSDRSDLASTLRLRGIAMQQCGSLTEAAASFRGSIAALRGKSAPEAWDRYNIACFQSLLSSLAGQPGSGMTAVEGRAEADNAMKTLQLAVAAGWRDAAWAAVDPDLAPIRSRPDFQLFVCDLGFPADPFAH
jgi:tetratricopeptide (TPR) repeat protein